MESIVPDALFPIHHIKRICMGQTSTMLEFMFVYTLGAIGYGAIELLWRGHTHWTMLLTGGLCFLLIYLVATRLALPLPLSGVLCAALITAVELFTGLLVNRALGWNVWDYSSLPLNLSGQICLLYSFYWLILSIPAVTLCRLLRRVLFS